jgi:hypothetical protein
MWSEIESKIGFRFLDRITAQYWSTVLGEEHGLSVHPSSSNYLRFGELSQREFKREILKKLFRVMQRLEDMILMRKYFRCFKRWKEMIKKSVAIYDDYRFGLKYIFAVWKEFTLIDKMNNKCRRHGSIILYRVLMKSIQSRLFKRFQKWKEWAKYCRKLIRKCFDSWSLWTLQSKLHKSNVLRFCKIFLLIGYKRSPKRLRWYFETWKHHSDLIGRILLIKNSMSL